MYVLSGCALQQFVAQFGGALQPRSWVSYGRKRDSIELLLGILAERLLADTLGGFAATIDLQRAGRCCPGRWEFGRGESELARVSVAGDP